MAPSQPSSKNTTRLSPDVQTAKNWYIWLWLSPVLTLPTWAFLVGVMLLTTGATHLTIPMTVLPVLGSALWHSILLIPALTGRSEFVRWHGRQALLLAGVRTAAMLLAVLASIASPYAWLWGGLVMITLWVFGTWWGQGQARRGDCWLMRKAGRSSELPVILVTSPRDVSTAPLSADRKKPADIDGLVEIIRFETDPGKRRAALAELERRGYVEALS